MKGVFSGLLDFDITWDDIIVGGIVGLGALIAAPVIGLPGLITAAIIGVVGKDKLVELFKGPGKQLLVSLVLEQAKMLHHIV